MIGVSLDQIAVASACLAALAAVVGTFLASRNAQKSIEALEVPFLIPDLGSREQWRLHVEQGAFAPALRVPMRNVGKGPAIMGDVQLTLDGSQLLSPAGGQIPFSPSDSQSLPLQLLADRPIPEQEGELRIYYTHASGAKYMTRCHVKIDEGGVLPTSFRRELSDGAERPFLFQSSPAV
jgi:hypothetical protein